MAIKPRRNGGDEAKGNSGNVAEGSGSYEQSMVLEKKKNLVETVLPIVVECMLIDVI